MVRPQKPSRLTTDRGELATTRALMTVMKLRSELVVSTLRSVIGGLQSPTMCRLKGQGQSSHPCQSTHGPGSLELLESSVSLLDSFLGSLWSRINFPIVPSSERTSHLIFCNKAWRMMVQ